METLPANRRILDKLDRVRFLFIVQIIEKAQKKAQFSFCGQRKAFHYEIVLRGIEPYFLHGLFSAVLKSVQPRQRRFGEFYCMVKKISTFVKGNLCTYQCFIDVKFISVSVLKEKLQNVPDWRWCDFVLNFPVCSADFHLRKRIHVLVKYYVDCF